MVRVNDLIFFPPSFANWLLQGGLNRPAWLFYQNTALPGLFYLDFKRALQRLRGNPGSQLSPCPLCCHPLPEPLLQPFLWECCREAPQTHLAKQCGDHASLWRCCQGLGIQRTKVRGRMLQPTPWHPARNTYPLPSWACVGRPPCDFGGKQMEFYPEVMINDSLAFICSHDILGTAQTPEKAMPRELTP